MAVIFYSRSSIHWAHNVYEHITHLNLAKFEDIFRLPAVRHTSVCFTGLHHHTNFRPSRGFLGPVLGVGGLTALEILHNCIRQPQQEAVKVAHHA